MIDQKNQPDRDEILYAIKSGVKEAFLQILHDQECRYGPPRDSILTMIEEGTRKAIQNMEPSFRE